MIHPTRDSLIALIMTLAGLAGFAWGLQRLLTYGENDAPGGIAVAVGGLTAFFGLLALLNFRWALRITRRMQRGEGIIARWTVPAETVTAYVAAERARPWHERSRWRPRSDAPAEILFSAHGVLAGRRYHGLASQGLNSFTAVELIQGSPNLIQFSTREIAVVGDRLTSQHSVLRLPIARGAEEPAAKVLSHYRQTLSGAIVARPDFWRKRQKIGLFILLLSAIAGGIGWVLAEMSGWQADGVQGMTAMILMIVGVIFGLAGLFLTVLASRFRGKERRG
jgi:hypothetical protein